MVDWTLGADEGGQVRLLHDSVKGFSSRSFGFELGDERGREGGDPCDDFLLGGMLIRAIFRV